MKYSNEELELLFNEIAQLIEYHEVSFTYSDQAWWDKDGVFHVMSMGEPGRMFTIALGETVDTILPDLMAKAWDIGADRIDIYFLGTCVLHSEPKRLEARALELQGSNDGLRILLQDINSLWQNYPTLLYDDTALASTVRQNTAQTLKEKLANLATGESDPHERLVKDIFDFVLNGCMRFLYAQKRSLNGSVIRDIAYTIKRNTELQQFLANAHLTANNLLIEAKNCKENDSEYIHQLFRYLGTGKIATVGILVTRIPLSVKHRQIIVDEQREIKGIKLILPLSDQDLQLMLHNAAVGRFDLNEQILLACGQQVLADTH